MAEPPMPQSDDPLRLGADGGDPVQAGQPGALAQLVGQAVHQVEHAAGAAFGPTAHQTAPCSARRRLRSAM